MINKKCFLRRSPGGSFETQRRVDSSNVSWPTHTLELHGLSRGARAGHYIGFRETPGGSYGGTWFDFRPLRYLAVKTNAVAAGIERVSHADI